MDNVTEAKDPIWATGIEAAQRRARRVRMLILSVFALRVVLSVTSDWTALLQLIIDVVLFVLVARLALAPPADGKLMPLADVPAASSMVADIARLGRKIGVEMEGVPVMINRASLGASPCVRSRERPLLVGLGKGPPMLEIPVGFLQVYQRDPGRGVSNFGP